MSEINSFVATREEPGQRIIDTHRQAAIEEKSQPKGALQVIVLPRHFIASTVGVCVTLIALSTAVVVASLAAWSMLH